ncbi:MAG: DUF819 family protein [Saprospiraceae bacterium]|nr:DUF819 family protein [Saprospiraceae bacterium]
MLLLMNLPLKNDAATFGVLILVLAAIFYTTQSKSPGWQKFYKYVPALLLCYFVPALLHWPLGIISSDDSKLYPFVSRYILPASLLLFCISLDLKEISRLGPKALIIFLAGTIGIIIGGPLALWLVNTLTPGILPAPATELWAGLSTIAGSWIGGGANQTAIKEIFEVPNTLFGTVVVVDIAVANLWMAVLLYGTGIHHKINKWLKADYSAIDRLRVKMEHFSASVTRQPTLPDLMILMGLTFGGVGLAHWLTDGIMPIMEVYKERLAAYELHALNSSFFWIVVLSTTLGILLSFTKARSFEGIGASKWASLFLYILVATIGMQMDLSQIGQNLGLISVGIIWMMIHITIILLVARMIRAPFFYVAVGSMANVGGAASAPVIASAFAPGLAPVGVLLAVLGYAIGTYGALICAYLMHMVAG